MYRYDLDLLQNRSHDRIHRLMGIYNANKKGLMQDRETFLLMYGDMLEQVATMMADK